MKINKFYNIETALHCPGYNTEDTLDCGITVELCSGGDVEIMEQINSSVTLNGPVIPLSL